MLTAPFVWSVAKSSTFLTQHIEPRRMWWSSDGLNVSTNGWQTVFTDKKWFTSGCVSFKTDDLLVYGRHHHSGAQNPHSFSLYTSFQLGLLFSTRVIYFGSHGLETKFERNRTARVELRRGGRLESQLLQQTKAARPADRQPLSTSHRKSKCREVNLVFSGLWNTTRYFLAAT